MEKLYLSDSAVEDVFEFCEADKSSSSSLGSSFTGETLEGAVGCLKESRADRELEAFGGRWGPEVSSSDSELCSWWV